MSILTVASKSVRLVRHGSLVIDQDQQSISIAGAKITISPAEFRLISLLTRHRDTVFSKAVILDVLFPPGHGRDLRQVDIFVTRLRQRFNAAGIGDVINTIAGRGYAVLDEEADMGSQRTGPRTDMLQVAA